MPEAEISSVGRPIMMNEARVGGADSEKMCDASFVYISLWPFQESYHLNLFSFIENLSKQFVADVLLHWLLKIMRTIQLSQNLCKLKKMVNSFQKAHPVRMRRLGHYQHILVQFILAKMSARRPHGGESRTWCLLCTCWAMNSFL